MCIRDRGNAGIAELAECVDIKAMEFEKLVAFAKENSIDLTAVSYTHLTHLLPLNSMCHRLQNVVPSSQQ